MDILITLYLFGVLLTAVLFVVNYDANNEPITLSGIISMVFFSLLSWFGMSVPLTELFNKLRSK